MVVSTSDSSTFCTEHCPALSGSWRYPVHSSSVGTWDPKAPGSAWEQCHAGVDSNTGGDQNDKVSGSGEGEAEGEPLLRLEVQSDLMVTVEVISVCKKISLASVQFSSVQSLSRVWLFATPWTAACQASRPSPTPGVYSNSCPLSQWCHPTISSSVVSFSCLQSFRSRRY